MAEEKEEELGRLRSSLKDAGKGADGSANGTPSGSVRGDGSEFADIFDEGGGRRLNLGAHEGSSASLSSLQASEAAALQAAEAAVASGEQPLREAALMLSAKMQVPRLVASPPEAPALSKSSRGLLLPAWPPPLNACISPPPRLAHDCRPAETRRRWRCASDSPRWRPS